MGDAKDAIWSAIFGLILALLSWLILSTVNPELTMIKTPGVSISTFTPSAGTTKTSFSWDGELTNPTCRCIDGSNLSNPSGNSCNTLCADSFIPNFRMGMSQMDGNTLATDKERAQKYATKFGYTWDTAIDYSMCADGHFVINAADFTSRFSDVTSMKLDRTTPFDGNCTDATNLDLMAEPNPGYFGPPAVSMACPLNAINTVYTDWEADPNCRIINTPTAVICPIKLCVTWTPATGPAVSKSRVQYLKFIKP